GVEVQGEPGVVEGGEGVEELVREGGEGGAGDGGEAGEEEEGEGEERGMVVVEWKGERVRGVGLWEVGEGEKGGQRGWVAG
ncbi:hypothetical protein, partial [Micrococcus luteus]|uniref:hypothetical protein n=1 Tax=Micrococcus luteus TaxID=1270 RepID=UPI001C93103C